jgi:cytidylate kinase
LFVLSFDRKSSVAKELAEKLNIYYLNTGMLYRSIAYILINVFGKKVEELDKISQKDIEFIPKIMYRYVGKEPQISFEDKNLTKELFHPLIEKVSSIISAKKEVREKLLELQRSLAQKYDLVAEGRDCGSVVFPDADYKFFLTADVESRARRIMTDEKRANEEMDLEKVKVELEARDKRDMQRKVSPLTIPDNAIVVDNSKMNKQETIKEFLRFIKK